MSVDKNPKGASALGVGWFTPLDRPLFFDALDCRGADGTNGIDGIDGQRGINCWDLNGNGVGDLPTGASCTNKNLKTNLETA